MKSTDITLKKLSLQLLPVTMRLPLKFGGEVVDSIVCARVSAEVVTRAGAAGRGYGETPLSVGWAWPGSLSFKFREDRMKEFTELLVPELLAFSAAGHPMEISARFMEERLPDLRTRFNAEHRTGLTLLAALICYSAFDLALHDAYGAACNLPTYETYNATFMNQDLGAYMGPDFAGKYPQDYFAAPPDKLPVWHLVGGKDLLTDAERTGNEPDDGVPVTLTEWIRRDGLKCLKIKLTGTDAAWDYARLVAVGAIAREYAVEHLSPDLNCMVRQVEYVNDLLDKLKAEHRDVWDKILYVEQPFPYELDEYPIDVHSLSERKPLYMDESAHDWKHVARGRELGWNGVALKVCKSQTGALLSMCYAKEHGMYLMVQDLTNPMLAVVPHVLLAAYAGTEMGVECNAPQFYPAASRGYDLVHPNLYRRRDGVVDLSTLGGNGFGYRIDQMKGLVHP